MSLYFTSKEIQKWLNRLGATYSEERGFQIRANQYGIKEAWRMQGEDEDLSEIACDLMEKDPEDRRPKSRRPVS